MKHEVQLSVLAGVVQTHIDLARLIPDRLLQNGRYLLLALEQLEPQQRDELARALLRLRICGGYLASHVLQINDGGNPANDRSAVERRGPVA